MTRRANSFKRGSVGEIELQISSPRSDSIGSPRAESPEASSAHASDSGAGGGGLHHHQNQQHLRFRLFKRPGSGAGAGEVVLGLGIRERRKLGNLMFLAFCAVCLLLGVGKIWASGWFALPGDDKNADLQAITVRQGRAPRRPPVHRQAVFGGHAAARYAMQEACSKNYRKPMAYHDLKKTSFIGDIWEEI